MDLIDRTSYFAEMRKRQEACKKAYDAAKNEVEREHWAGVYMAFAEAKLTLDILPAIEVVPLDALCEWLAKSPVRPCQMGIARCALPTNEDDTCEPAIKCWKAVLKKWMEQQHEL